jgi:hypothetical protein
METFSDQHHHMAEMWQSGDKQATKRMKYSAVSGNFPLKSNKKPRWPVHRGFLDVIDIAV